MKYCGLLLTILLSSCIYDPSDNRLRIVNYRNADIVIYWNSDTIPEFPSINDTEVYLINYGIKSLDSLQVAEDHANWPGYLENIPNKKLNLFIYSSDTLKKYKNIDTVNSRGKYRRIAYSKEQLERMDWRIEIKNGKQ